MDIALLAVITAASCLLAALLRKWIVTLGVAVGIVAAVRLLGLHPSPAGAVLDLDRPAVRLLDGGCDQDRPRHHASDVGAARPRAPAHRATRIGLVLATARLLILGLRLVR
jgi:hypothetical protein